MNEDNPLSPHYKSSKKSPWILKAHRLIFSVCEYSAYTQLHENILHENIFETFAVSRGQ